MVKACYSKNTKKTKHTQPPPHRRRALHFFLTPLAPTLYYYLYTSKAGKGVDDLLTWMGEDLASHLCARQMKAGCSGHGRHLWALAPLRQGISERLVGRTYARSRSVARPTPTRYQQWPCLIWFFHGNSNILIGNYSVKQRQFTKSTLEPCAKNPKDSNEAFCSVI